jgi:alpha-glucosidase/alpha-D-xyloside xylohydrolase
VSRKLVVGTFALFIAAWRASLASQTPRVDVRSAGAASLRVSVHASASSLAPRVIHKRIGAFVVDVSPAPLAVDIHDTRGRRVQRLAFESDGSVRFDLDDAPVLGMGEGGPRADRGTNWRDRPVQFDRRGRLDTMEPRWQSDMYGSRNPVAMLIGTSGWALFFAKPWGQIDLRAPDHGILIPWIPADSEHAPQTARNQGQNINKGRPSVASVVPGEYDIFVFDAHDPAAMMRDYSRVTGLAVLPPKWTLGYMQSHRTIEDETQLLRIIDTFREKRIPLDAVIYLGTGFAPRGWNTTQPSFTFNPDVFKRDPKTVIDDMHARHVKVAVHIVPFDRHRLPTLHGSIPPSPGETLDDGHIATYWRLHVPLLDAGVDAFWPDEGDWFNLDERLERHEMYYEGPLSSRPHVRPWSLHRNGYVGIAQWGGWVWSGDTESSWKTLEAQIAVGLNHSLSLSPYWGSDIGGFYPTRELTGELYARWYQFAAFTPSFRAHGRTWWTRLPWGFGLSDMGPREGNATNTPSAADERGIQQSAMNDSRVEPIARAYDELRYQLLPYNYTLAWEARETGLPLMRALWLHYPNDSIARALGTEYLWGRDLLIAPVFTPSASSRDVYLPAGAWYDWWTNARLAGGQTVTRGVALATMPIYVRAGAIIPVDPVRQYTSEPVTAPTTLRVYPGADGDFTLYDDDGISQAYLSGDAAFTRIRWNDRMRMLTVEPDERYRSSRARLTRNFDVVLMPGGAPQRVHFAGQRAQVRL